MCNCAEVASPKWPIQGGVLGHTITADTYKAFLFGQLSLLRARLDDEISTKSDLEGIKGHPLLVS